VQLLVCSRPTHYATHKASADRYKLICSYEFTRGMLTKAGTDVSAFVSLIKAYSLCRYRVSNKLDKQNTGSVLSNC